MVRKDPLRFGPLAVVATVWVAVTALFPSDEPGSGAQVAAGASAGATALGSDGAGSSGVGSSAVGDTGGVGASEAAAGAAAGAGGASGASAGAAAGGEDPQALAANAASGKTRGGVDCSPGARQVPLSSYAIQCQPAFTGDNGGATYRGVTADTIRIVERTFPDTANSQAVAAVGEQAGAASEADQQMVFDTFFAHFNEHYELYGRTVELVRYESQFGSATNEVQSKGREEACLDADVVANELQAFAVIGQRGSANTGPFSECAAQRGVVVLNGAAYFPETFYRSHHPFVWATTMECERISYQVAEYLGKRLVGKPARWAGDPALRERERRFATYVPNNDEYQHCVDITERESERMGHGDANVSRYNYTLDVSRFPDEAARGIVQFKADGATTIVLACDPISIIFLTQSAAAQSYRPEWFLLGVALQDTDNLAQLYDQSVVDGSLFGMSQLGATTKLIGANSEAGRMFESITGSTIPDGTAAGYFDLQHALNLLQAAGPTLTPDAIAAGAATIMPGGAPDFALGYWSYADGPDGTPGAGDHTAVDDSREIYWTSAFVSEETGKAGTFIETYGGRRFRNGEWPAEEPPVYPEA
jgi:hypothetical protein